MMAAQTGLAITTGKMPDTSAGELPLEAPIYPYTEADGRLLICAFYPDKQLWCKGKVEAALLTHAGSR